MEHQQDFLIHGLVAFIAMLNEFKAVKRTIYAVGEDRKENDAEHSYQLAMVAWYLNSVYNLGLNLECLILYSLVHDLPEVFAGDVCSFTSTEEQKRLKWQREAEALDRIKEQFPEFPDLVRYMRGYEQSETRESKFVKALDKLLAATNVFLDFPRVGRQNGVQLVEMRDVHRQKMEGLDNFLTKLYEGLAHLMPE